MEPDCTELGGACGPSSHPWWVGAIIVVAFWFAVLIVVHVFQQRCGHGRWRHCESCRELGAWYVVIGTGPPRRFAGPYLTARKADRAWRKLYRTFQADAQLTRYTARDLDYLHEQGFNII